MVIANKINTLFVITLKDNINALMPGTRDTCFIWTYNRLDQTIFFLKLKLSKILIPSPPNSSSNDQM